MLNYVIFFFVLFISLYLIFVIISPTRYCYCNPNFVNLKNTFENRQFSWQELEWVDTRCWPRHMDGHVTGRDLLPAPFANITYRLSQKIDWCVRLSGRHIHRTLDRDANRIFGNVFRLGSFDQLATIGYLGLTLV